MTSGSVRVHIRDATLCDLPAMTTIYADAVEHTLATLDTSTPTLESRTEWFHHHDDRHSVLVADMAGKVIGWASVSAWSDKGGYRDTAEASVYVAPEWHRQGIGKTLLTELASRAQSIGLHVLLARISTTNQTSLNMVRGIGFGDVGTMREVGHKFGKPVDVQVLQMLLDGQPDASHSR
ncbi:MAG: N-acetyltransferase family protein [Dehalococcoidia bacterium]|nr:MAG: N-acetyltransferase family protein [Dehalococcoidia bacterium]